MFLYQSRLRMQSNRYKAKRAKYPNLCKIEFQEDLFS